MSDTAIQKNPAGFWNSEEQKRKLARRHAADKRLQYFGMGAIGLAILLLGILVASLVSTGYVAFVQSKVRMEIPLDAAKIDAEKPRDANYRVIVRNAFRSLFPKREIAEGAAQYRQDSEFGSPLHRPRPRRREPGSDRQDHHHGPSLVGPLRPAPQRSYPCASRSPDKTRNPACSAHSSTETWSA